MENKTVTWSQNSLDQFEAAINHIKDNSVQNAESVRSQLLLQLSQLTQFSDIHPLDKYKDENDGSYRSFESFHLRITYRVMENEIRVIRIRHTRMRPLRH